MKASVRAAQGGTHFAVLVAGSGPTDRNWSNPLLPASYGGRDFAGWLQKQGIGSLRYDKRFIGSKDPALDISLDAQVGDIRGALAAARALPEAKGKRLLLIGHSEGALLSLLAAADADALLLLEPPAQSMAKTIRAQLALQLPEATAAENLAYLEAVFAAIRAGDPAPDGGPGVYPALVKLGRSLMAKESLGFVRATLDLEPLALAQRVALPCALAWGDKDVQTWKPERLPEGFPHPVLVLKDANHLLKREPRPRAELNGATAVAGYGDGAAMADLAPLAAWLKTLK
ncbi:MAG: alpha/beta fold hydrolase [Holophagaceae bacterium]|nr:alpha/beta fold hydrolase [Holophagaceae bacterium]